MNRGLIAVQTKTGIFLSWRLFKREATGAGATGLTGVDFKIFRNGNEIATVTDSTNYLDTEGKSTDRYCVEPILPDALAQKLSAFRASQRSAEVSAFRSGENYIDVPVKRPEGGITPAGEAFTYHLNDMSVGDVNGDGEYEYIVKWDPSNSHDVSHRGYTGRCIIDCYTLSGTLLWRLDMGPNIRAGAHYTQFMVYDLNGDGRAEMVVKSAPGTKMTRYNADGSILSEAYISIPESDLRSGIRHEDNYVCSAEITGNLWSGDS